MCNLCGIFSNSGIITPELAQIVIDTQLLGSEKHGDGAGFFTPSKYSRNPAKAGAGFFSMADKMTGEKFLYTHIRKVSSGRISPPKQGEDDKEWKAYMEQMRQFTHPFITDKVMVMHNGTLTPKDSKECDMDSKYFTAKLDEAYDTEKCNYVEALEHAFSFFTEGLYSMFLAFKTPGGYVPLILKGNKPLHAYKCYHCDEVIYVTDPDFLTPVRLLANIKTKHYFIAESYVAPSLFNPLTGEVLYSGLFLTENTRWVNHSASTSTTMVPAVSRPTTPTENSFKDLYRQIGTYDFGLKFQSFLDTTPREELATIIKMDQGAFFERIKAVMEKKPESKVIIEEG